MEELIEKVENLKETISKTEEANRLNELNKKIMQDKELLKDIEEYNKNQDERIKERIIKNPHFREYKKAETDFNLIILGINQKLKELSNERKGCI